MPSGPRSSCPPANADRSVRGPGRIPAGCRERVIEVGGVLVDLHGVAVHAHLSAHRGRLLDPASELPATASGSSSRWPVARARSQPCSTTSASTMSPIIDAGMRWPPMSISPSQAPGSDQAVARSRADRTAVRPGEPSSGPPGIVGVQWLAAAEPGQTGRGPQRSRVSSESTHSCTVWRRRDPLLLPHGRWVRRLRSPGTRSRAWSTWLHPRPSRLGTDPGDVGFVRRSTACRAVVRTRVRLGWCADVHRQRTTSSPVHRSARTPVGCRWRCLGSR